MTASYVLSGLVVGVLEGAVLYILDSRVGVRAYRWWYGLTHRDPLPPGVRRGFVYDRKANARFTAATIVSLLQNGLAYELGFVDPLKAMLAVLVEVPVIMGGFYLGPFVERLWRKKDPLLAVVDKLESGETSVRAEVKRMTESVAGSVRESLAAPAEEVPPPTAPRVEPAPPPPPPEPDPAEALRSYTKRQR
jgi:hypothetical protein